MKIEKLFTKFLAISWAQIDNCVKSSKFTDFMTKKIWFSFNLFALVSQLAKLYWYLSGHFILCYLFTQAFLILEKDCSQMGRFVTYYKIAHVRNHR